MLTAGSRGDVQPYVALGQKIQQEDGVTTTVNLFHRYLEELSPANIPS